MDGNPNIPAPSLWELLANKLSAGATRLREWDALLAEAQTTLAGILPREERRQAKELCGYRH